MSLTQKKQNSIKEYVMECFQIYEDTGSLDESDFEYCYNKIFSLWNKKSTSKTPSSI